MAENFTNPGKETDTHTHETLNAPNKRNSKRLISRHSIIKCKKCKNKERILNTAKNKTICYVQGNPYKTIRRFFSRNTARQKGSGMIQSQYLQEKLPIKIFLTLQSHSELKDSTFQTTKS